MTLILITSYGLSNSVAQAWICGLTYERDVYTEKNNCEEMKASEGDDL